MRRSRLAILAILSLALLPILLSSYGPSYEFWVNHFDTPRQFRECSLGFGIGIVVLQYDAGVENTPNPLGWHSTFRRFPRASLRQFREHLLYFRIGSSGRPIQYSCLMFPAWLPALLCTIAPILWLRRRRKINPPGFAVEPSAMTEGTGKTPLV